MSPENSSKKSIKDCIIKYSKINSSDWKSGNEIDKLKLKNGIKKLKRNLLGRISFGSSLKTESELIEAFLKLDIPEKEIRYFIDNSESVNIENGISSKGLFITKVYKFGEFEPKYKVEYKFY